MATKKAGKNVAILLIVFPFIVFGYFITRGINLPYVGYNAWNFNTYSHIAKNYNTFGLLQTKFAPVISIAASVPSHPEYYLHHPQLLYAVMSLFFKVFGDDHWVGRLPVILATIGTVICIYLTGTMLKGKLFGLIALCVSALIPATSVFGRMIGHEAFVLFFVLLSIYFLLLYFKTKSTIFLFFVLVSIVLGTLSDWPMVYFTVALAPFLMQKKRYKLALLLVATSVVTAFLFLLYIFFLTGNVSDLQQAFFVRSTGELLTYSYWPLRWIGTIMLRIILYFNPIVLFFTGVYFFRLVASGKWKTITPYDLLIICLLLFGFIHILLYPEGSFGHAYWIYYLLPFVVFSSASVLLPFINKKYIVLLVPLFILTLVFTIVIEYWKTKEVEGNIFRYSLAQKANHFLKPYETIVTNRQSVIDQDLWMYEFHHPIKNIDPENVSNTSNFRVYVYSCMQQCSVRDNNFLLLYKKYNYSVINDSGAQLYVFNLRDKNIPEKSNSLINGFNPTSSSHVTENRQESFLRKAYRNIKDVLQAPQI